MGITNSIFGKGDGYLIENEAGDLEDYDTDLSALAGRLSVGDNLKMILSYQRVGDHDYENGWGDDDRTSIETFNNVSRIDFVRADERSINAKLQYEFDSIPGLKFMSRYTYGDNFDHAVKPGEEGSEWERRIELKYSFPKSSSLGGLSLKFQNTTVRSTNTYDSNENRLNATYKF